MQHILAYRKEVEAALESYPFPEAPEELYAPIAYILSLGGKKLRAILTLLACEAFGAERARAMQAAIAVEAFHNFTLIHDDIMDEAPLRRGFPTVHTKWDNTTALLSGDALMILSYQMLGQYDPQTFSTLFQIFNRTALEVCEGQQMDINFESASTITEEQYIEMIRLKTAVLVGCALQLGAIVGGAAARDQEALPFNCRTIT